MWKLNSMHAILTQPNRIRAELQVDNYSMQGIYFDFKVPFSTHDDSFRFSLKQNPIIKGSVSLVCESLLQGLYMMQ